MRLLRWLFAPIEFFLDPDRVTYLTPAELERENRSALEMRLYAGSLNCTSWPNSRFCSGSMLP